MTSKRADLAWMDEAACAGLDPSLFLPTGRGRAANADIRAAKRFCLQSGCPVLFECREYAIADPRVFGVWGGMSEQQRRNERWDRQRAGTMERRPTPRAVPQARKVS